jgi:hypothetical protein
MEGEWITYRGGIRLAHELTGSIVSIMGGKWPARGALLWQAAQGKVRVEADEWVQRPGEGEASDGHREKFLDLLWRREAGRLLSDDERARVEFVHDDYLTGSFVVEITTERYSEPPTVLTHYVRGLRFRRCDIVEIFADGGSPAKPRPKTPGETIEPLSNGAFDRWWNGLSDMERCLPQKALQEMCAKAHPTNTVARRRIRERTEGRKRGPKPIR